MGWNRGLDPFRRRRPKKNPQAQATAATRSENGPKYIIVIINVSINACTIKPQRRRKHLQHVSKNQEAKPHASWGRMTPAWASSKPNTEYTCLSNSPVRVRFHAPTKRWWGTSGCAKVRS